VCQADVTERHQTPGAEIAGQMLHFITEHHVVAARLRSMWLACALIILFSVGFVLPCMLDITTTPDSEFTTLTKGTWLVIAGAFWVFGATAWLIVGRPRRPSMRRWSDPYAGQGFDAMEALQRHPAAQAMGNYGEFGGSVAFDSTPLPLGPDDDPDFLLELDRRIREAREGSLADAN
jgi:hypothetical protein